MGQRGVGEQSTGEGVPGLAWGVLDWEAFLEERTLGPRLSKEPSWRVGIPGRGDSLAEARSTLQSWGE